MFTFVKVYEEFDAELYVDARRELDYTLKSQTRARQRRFIYIFLRMRAHGVRVDQHYS